MGDKQNDLVHQVKVLDIRSQIKRGLWSDTGFGTENQERAKLAREAKDPNSITETAIEEVAKYIAQEQKRLQDAHESVRLKDFNELADKWLLLLEDDNFVYANNMRKIIKETQDKLITLSTEMKGSTKEGAERFYKKVAEQKTSDSNDLPALNVIVDDDSMGKDRYVDVKTQLNVRNKDKKVIAALDR